MVDQLRFFAGAARVLEGKAAGEYMAGHTSWIRREPIGVVGQVTPWNYPLLMAVWKIAPALAAGNTVVLKPSDTTPETHAAAGRDRLRVPPGRGAQRRSPATARPAGCSSSTRHPGLVAITGSVRAGAEVAASAAPSVKRVHLELGGKAPVVVFDDADIEAAVEGIAIAGYFNAGQDCTAATRVLAAPRHPRRLRRGARGVRQRLGPGRPARPTRTPSSARSTTPASSRTCPASSTGCPSHATVSAGGNRRTATSATASTSSPPCSPA